MSVDNEQLEAIDPAEISQAIGGRLREAREDMGWTLDEAALQSGGRFAATSLDNYERGFESVAAVALVELAALYEVDAEWLLTGMMYTDAEAVAKALRELAIGALKVAAEVDGDERPMVFDGDQFEPTCLADEDPDAEIEEADDDADCADGVFRPTTVPVEPDGGL